MKDEGSQLPAVFSPEEVADHFGWSARALRQKIREIGACRVLNNRVIMTIADVEALLEATKPVPQTSISKPLAGGYARLLKMRAAPMPRRSNDDRRPFTPKALSQRWQCSERHVRNLIAKGELPAKKLGGKLIRIMIDDVEHFEEKAAARQHQPATD